MSRWVIKGLQTGIVTTRYPDGEENTPGTSPGLSGRMKGENAVVDALIRKCPTGALHHDESGSIVTEPGRCIHCYRCKRMTRTPMHWDTGFEWARTQAETGAFSRALRRSVHIRVVDAGDCGACLNEIKLLNNPFYNMHRLGFFITPTPRKADVLLVSGPVTEHMKTALLKAYEAMPAPKKVMVVGTCAHNGGVFGANFVSGNGIGDLFPVDVAIPGCPPPPLAILHGLLVLTGRKPPAIGISENNESTKKYRG